MSKGLTMLIIGAFIGWLVMSFFTKDYEANILMVLIVGAILGYQVGKKQKE